jgi:hypothetical protein
VIAEPRINLIMVAGIKSEDKVGWRTPRDFREMSKIKTRGSTYKVRKEDKSGNGDWTSNGVERDTAKS